MIKLIAVSYEDGWGFVEINQMCYLVKPPYKKYNKIVVEKPMVEKAILNYGFESVDEVHRGWNTLIKYLKNKMNEYHKGDNLLSQEELAQGLLELAPARALARYLDRIEKELIPNHRWDVSLTILTKIMCLEILQENSNKGLLQKTIDLIKSCHKSKEARERRLAELQNISSPSSNITEFSGDSQLARNYSQFARNYSQNVRERKSTFFF